MTEQMSERVEVTTSTALQTKMTMLDRDGNSTSFEGEQAWAMVEAQRPYQGVARINPLPACKSPATGGRRRSGGKNPAGGRKAVFSQSKEYKRRHPNARYAKTSKQLSQYEWPSGVSRIGTGRWHGWEPKEATT